MQYADAIGLAFFSITGARIAQSAGLSPFVATMMGAITGCAGGLIRGGFEDEVLDPDADGREAERDGEMPVEEDVLGDAPPVVRCLHQQPFRRATAQVDADGPGTTQPTLENLPGTVTVPPVLPSPPLPPVATEMEIAGTSGSGDSATERAATSSQTGNWPS